MEEKKFKTIDAAHIHLKVNGFSNVGADPTYYRHKDGLDASISKGHREYIVNFGKQKGR